MLQGKKTALGAVFVPRFFPRNPANIPILCRSGFGPNVAQSRSTECAA